jgi:aryl sulfotransferase
MPATLPAPAVPNTAPATPVLHASYVKSGSYLLWRTFDLLFRADGHKRSFVQQHPIQACRGQWPDFSIEQFDIDQILVQDDAVHWQIETRHIEPIGDLKAYLAQCSHVWTHSFVCERSWEVYPRFGAVFYMVRDPRDALVSMAHFQQTPFMRRYHPHPATTPAAWIAAESERFLADWCRHAGDHLRARRALGIEVLRYEDFVADLPAALRAIVERIRLPLADAALAEVAAALRPERMRERSPQHVRSGRSGGFAELLDEHQQRRALELCGPLMRGFGYPV